MKRKRLIQLVLVIILSGVFLFGSAVLAQHGLEETAGAAGLTKYGKSVPTIIGNVVGTALSLVSVVFFVLMIYGGFLWMTAHGNEEFEKKAVRTIQAAIIGIIIVLASYAITSFVFQSVKSDGSAGSTTPAATPAPSGLGPIGDDGLPEVDLGACEAINASEPFPAGTVVDDIGLPEPLFDCVENAVAGDTCHGEPLVGLCPGPATTLCCQPKS